MNWCFISPFCNIFAIFFCASRVLATNEALYEAIVKVGGIGELFSEAVACHPALIERLGYQATLSLITIEPLRILLALVFSFLSLMFSVFLVSLWSHRLEYARGWDRRTH